MFLNNSSLNKQNKSVPKYKMFWEAKLTDRNILYFGTERGCHY
jgi:hypothetical protein